MVRDELAEAERKRLEDEQRPIREAELKLTQTHRKLADLAKAEVIAGRPDPDWTLPQSASDLHMSAEEALKFVGLESDRFVRETPDYHRCPENQSAVVKYLLDQHVLIPNADCFRDAWQRLKFLGLISEKPEPRPEPTAASTEPEPIKQEAPPQSELTDGWDIVTGEPRKFTQAEIWKMSSGDLKKAFRMWTSRDGDRRPLMRKSMYQ
jgi:hypothetical protein